jgi:hypothetical protein
MKAQWAQTIWGEGILTELPGSRTERTSHFISISECYNLGSGFSSLKNPDSKETDEEPTKAYIKVRCGSDEEDDEASGDFSAMKNGGSRRARTADPMIKSHLLYQLS